MFLFDMKIVECERGKAELFSKRCSLRNTWKAFLSECVKYACGVWNISLRSMWNVASQRWRGKAALFKWCSTFGRVKCKLRLREVTASPSWCVASQRWRGKAPKVALEWRIESGEWRIRVEKLRFSSLIIWCLPFVAFLRYGNDNRACGSCGGRLR